LSRAEAALRRIVADLGSLGRRFALVGGLAVSVWTEPRLTRDADLAVLVGNDRDAEALVRDLVGLGWRVAAAIEQSAAGRLAAVRLTLPGDDARGTVVDLLFASSGIEPEIVAAAEPIEALAALIVPVARLGHLIALKVLARDDRTRPQDRVDLAALLARADAAALAMARQALALVAERGYDRERELIRALNAAMDEFRQ
jgi:nucleotidyltransferase AbiEii toxin of type IV toxin-antitoxin system